MKYWQTNDYHISVNNWLDFLQKRSIFSEHDIAVVEYIYNQPNYQAAATEIGKQLEYSYQTINSKNSQLSRRVLQEIGKEPYIKPNGKKRYWHVLFTKGEHYLNSNKNYTYWVLRENLRLALSLYLKRSSKSGLDDDTSNYFDKNEAFLEGKTIEKILQIQARNQKARRKCLEHFGCTCKSCGFTAAEIYGENFAGIIHVHHLNPLNEIEDEYSIDPIVDLIPLCPNCHAAVHKRTPPYTIKEINDFKRKELRNNKKHK